MFNTIFSVLDKKKNPSEEEINKIAPFIFLKWLGSDPRTIQAANQLNLYYNIPMINQYNLVKVAFAGKGIYLSYPKNVKDDSKEREIISRHYKISLVKAKEYMELMSKEEINTIIKLYERM